MQKYPQPQQTKSSYKIVWNKTIDNRKFIKDQFPEYSKRQIEQALKVIENFNQQFVIDKYNHSWKVIKSHSEIQFFLTQFQKKYGKKSSFSSLSQFLNHGIKQILIYPQIEKWEQFVKFFEVQDIQYNKVKSLDMQKKAGGRHTDNCCKTLIFGWDTKRFIINFDGLMYKDHQRKIKKFYNQIKIQSSLRLKTSNNINNQHDQMIGIKQFIPFDSYFKMEFGKNSTGYQRGVLVRGQQRDLLIRAKTLQQFYKFIYFTTYAVKMSQLDNQQRNRFDSFAPQRNNNQVQFYIDGVNYFKDVALAIQKAKQDIYITGWWVSPQFSLIRPYSQNLKYRLDNLLFAAANRNVKVFILVYLQSSLIFNDSQYTQQTLQKHPNIKVIRHPLKVLPILWTHHEKLVVVDQQIAFLGGLDITYGRYDDQNHDLAQRSNQVYYGIQYNNARIKDVQDVRNWRKQSIPRNLPRLPWHDIALKLTGQSVLDYARHFVEYWNYANFQKNYQQGYMLTIGRKKQKTQVQKIDYGQNRQKGFALDLLGAALNNNSNYNLIGVDQNRMPKQQNEKFQKNSNLSSIKNIEQGNSKIKNQSKYLNNLQVVKVLPQKESMESQKCKQSQIDSLSKKSKSSKFITKKFSKIYDFYEAQQGQNACIQEKQNYQYQIMQNLMKLIDNKFKNSDESPQKISRQSRLQIRQNLSKNSLIKKVKQTMFYSFQCQALRSASNWSIGLRKTQKQKSIQNAYLWMIQSSKNFIYIENQYFISAIEGLSPKNEIMEALFKRIQRAINGRQKFKVIVVFPLIPGYPGQLYKDEGQAPRIIMHWQYQTICRHPNSLYRKLQKLTKNPHDYIEFYGLRTHAILDEKPTTEIIYVHSKLMIVDDKYVICGSANINDRSMNGGRDSELGLFVSGGKPIKIKFGKNTELVSEKIHQLRINIFKQHFGISQKQAQDPLNPKMIDIIRKRAKKNTQFYRQIFGCYPDDNIRTIKQIHPFIKKQINIQKYNKLKKEVIGHVVEQPLKFLDHQNLIKSAANLYPDQIFT